MQKINELIAQSILDALKKIAPDSGLDEKEIVGMLEYPPDPAMGDVALPCFRLSRSLHRSPVQIADALAKDFSCECVGRAAAVNGYFNLYLSDEYLAGTVVPEILEKGDRYGSSDIGEGKEVVLDYSSPNLQSPFTSDTSARPLSDIRSKCFMNLPVTIAPVSITSVTGAPSSAR